MHDTVFITISQSCHWIDIYFPFRFKDIGGTFESVLSGYDLIKDEKCEWRLAATKTAWECLQRCWADKVFIAQLTHRSVFRMYVL